MLDLSRLRIFVAVARQRSFTRAAEALYLAQPTVSQQVQVLERELGTQLLVRAGRRVELTAAGAALLEYAERLLALAAEAEHSVRQVAGMASHTLLLGAGTTLATYVLPDLLRRLQYQQPEITIEVQVGNTEELVEQLQRGTLELALIGQPHGQAYLDDEPFLNDELVLIVPPEHRLAAASSTDLRELGQEILLAREAGSALQSATAQLLVQAGVTPRRLLVLASLEAIKRGVEAGLGVAIVPRLSIDRELAAGALAMLTLPGQRTSRSFVVAWLRSRTPGPAAQSFLTLLRTPLGPAPR